MSNQALEQARDSVLRYGEQFSCPCKTQSEAKEVVDHPLLRDNTNPSRLDCVA
jgi:hypothetical protein